jgi:hypothetical protein
MQEIRADSSLDQQARRDKMRPIMEKQNEEMKKILKPDQVTKYEENQKKAKGNRKKKTE